MRPNIGVVGGSYEEECAFPRRRIFRGSGGRAAALLSSLDVQTDLHTVIGSAHSAQAESLASHLGYVLRPTASDQSVWFRYRFPLGRPELYPPQPIVQNQSQVTTEQALVFGMVEGRPKVIAKRAVYDPQDGSKSRHFEDNGSSADVLAQVVSWSEGRALTGFKDPKDIAAALLARPSTSVAIIKCGPQGALVATHLNQAWVHSFPTKNVYKIGSGDVFSASFAYGWMCLQQAPVAAAWFASRCVAHYVEHGVDRLNEKLVATFISEANAAHAKHGAGERRFIPEGQIYLAGPFFNVGQQWVIDETRGALQDMGFRVFSPIHKVGEGLADDIAGADLKALNESLVVLAILDGGDPGTLFEVGYARARGIPVVAVAEDVPPSALTMLEGSDCDVVQDLTSAIYRTCWTLMGDV